LPCTKEGWSQCCLHSHGWWEWQQLWWSLVEFPDECARFPGESPMMYEFLDPQFSGLLLMTYLFFIFYFCTSRLWFFFSPTSSQDTASCLGERWNMATQHVSLRHWPLSLLLYYCSLCIDHSLLFKYCYYLIHTISYFSINRLPTGINIPCGITPQKAQ
jgi:hypothetical protein